MSKDKKATKAKKAPAKAGSASQSDNFKNALCYIPLVAVVLFFVESNKSAELLKHIKYGVMLFVGYVVLHYILGILHLGLGGILFLIYVGISAYLVYKAYTGEKIELEYLDKLEDTVKSNIK